MTFIKTFKKYIKQTDYKYVPEKTLEWNEANLKRMSYLESSCSILYEKLESTYGEDYADYILSNVLQKNFIITQFDKYPLSEFPCLSERVFLDEYLHYTPLNTGGRTHSCNLNTFYTSAYREVLGATKRSADIELYDFLICFSLLVEKWKITNYAKFVEGKRESKRFFNSILNQFIYSLFAKNGERQHITITILDKDLFDSIIRRGDYSVIIDGHTQESLKATYDIYLKGLHYFFNAILRYCKGGKSGLVAPHVRTYACASSKLLPEIIESIQKDTGVDESVVYDIFKHVNFDAFPQCLDTPEYEKAFHRLSLIKTRKSNVVIADVKKHVKEIFNTDYKAYLNMRNKKLSYFINQYNLDKQLPSYETIYFKMLYDKPTPLIYNKFSEVTINAKFIIDNSANPEEFQEKLYKAVLDAQAINQMRLLLAKKPHSFVLNIKLDNLDEELNSLACNVMERATDYLRSTYNQPFTYELSQRIFFRDKSRECYLLLSQKGIS